MSLSNYLGPSGDCFLLIWALQSDVRPNTIPGQLLLVLSLGLKREKVRKKVAEMYHPLSPVRIILELPFKSGKIHPMTSA